MENINFICLTDGHICFGQGLLIHTGSVGLPMANSQTAFQHKNQTQEKERISCI